MKLLGMSSTKSISKCKLDGNQHGVTSNQSGLVINGGQKMTNSRRIGEAFHDVIQWKLSIIVFALIVMSFSAVATAGNFSVSPVRIYMSPKDRATAVTVINDGDNELVMQADLYEWKQKPDGEDELKLTEDMFLSPPIIKLAPKSRQVVRLARLVPLQSSDQITYRMIVREIPEAKTAGKELDVQIALAFSLPVFITPPGAKAKLSCSTERVTANTINAVCENTGNAYSHPTAILLNTESGAKIAENQGGYILPGIKRRFVIKRDIGVIPPGEAQLALTLDDGTTETYAVTIAN